MRLVSLVLLMGICLWLAIERHTLTTKVTDLEARLAEAEKPTQKNWLQQRIDQNGRSLEVPPSRVFSPGGYRPQTANSRIIR